MRRLSAGTSRIPAVETRCHQSAALFLRLRAEWDGKAEQWTVVRRNQFTDVTGPGGIFDNQRPATDPLWSLGWDAKSLVLMLRNADNPVRKTPPGADRIVRVTEKSQASRLPKVSHRHDGAHGWNTKWPRIRDIGKSDLLMTMQGAFRRFPKTFSSENHRKQIRFAA